MDVNYFYIAIVAIALLVVGWVLSIELRLKKIFKGKKAQDLEEVFVSLGEELKKLDIAQEEIKKYLESAEKRLKNSIQSINTVRFNPFGDSGSNQSFSIAFLNENNDGVVISSLHSREGVRIYAKPIKNRQSEYTLTEEEKEAIKNTSHEL